MKNYTIKEISDLALKSGNIEVLKATMTLMEWLADLDELETLTDPGSEADQEGDYVN